MKKNRLIAFSLLSLLVLLVASLAASAAELPITLERVEIDDVEIRSSDTNRLDVQRDQEIEVEVKFNTSRDLKDIIISGKVSGFEYNLFEPVYDEIQKQDYDANISYVRKLKLQLSDEMEEDEYLLRIEFVDKANEAFIQNFPIKIDVPRHSLAIEDVYFYPNGGAVVAGQALITTARVENKGEKDEDDVRVEVSIPELGVSAVDYIEEIESDEERETEEIFNLIPHCAPEGLYGVKIAVSFNERFSEAEKTVPINVIGSNDPACDVNEDTAENSVPSQEQPRTRITVASQLEEITIGEGAGNFPVTVTNEGANSMAYTIRVSDANNFADVRISPSNTVVLDSGASQVFYLFVTPSETATVGPHAFTATISSGADVLQQVPLTANVLPAKAPERTGSSVTNTVLIVVLIIVIVIIILLIIAILVRSVGGNKEDGVELDENQTYY